MFDRSFEYRSLPHAFQSFFSFVGIAIRLLFSLISLHFNRNVARHCLDAKVIIYFICIDRMHKEFRKWKRNVWRKLKINVIFSFATVWLNRFAVASAGKPFAHKECSLNAECHDNEATVFFNAPKLQSISIMQTITVLFLRLLAKIKVQQTVISFFIDSERVFIWWEKKIVSYSSIYAILLRERHGEFKTTKCKYNSQPCRKQ